MTEKEKKINNMIDEVTSTTFGVTPYQVKLLKKKYLKAPMDFDEVKEIVEGHCKAIQDKATNSLFK